MLTLCRCQPSAVNTLIAIGLTDARQIWGLCPAGVIRSLPARDHRTHSDRAGEVGHLTSDRCGAATAQVGRQA